MNSNSYREVVPEGFEYNHYSEIEKDGILDVKTGIKEAADLTVSTMGHYGRNVMIHSKGVHVFKDGISALSFYRPKNKSKLMGSIMLNDASRNTEKIAGDGTTTTACLIRAMINQLDRFSPDQTKNVWQIKNEIEEAVDLTIERLRKISKPVNEKTLFAIAKTSANNDPDLGKVISDLIWKVKEDGVVDIKESGSDKTYSDFQNGYHFKPGLIAGELLDGAPYVELIKPLVFICNDKVGDSRYFTDHIYEPWKKMCEQEKRIIPILFICDDANGSFLSYSIVNKEKLPIFPVAAPMSSIRRTMMLEDIQAITKTEFILDDTRGQIWDTIDDKFGINSFGTCEKAKVSMEKCVIYLEESEEVKSIVKTRVEQIDLILKDDKNSSDLEKSSDYKNWLLERKSSLTSGLGVIYMKRTTDIESENLRKVIDDTVLACKTALRTAVLPGASSALYKIGVDAVKEKIGHYIVFNSLKDPLLTIYENAAMTSDDIMATGYDPSKPWLIPNVGTKECIDCEKEGILDPLGVSETALRHAAQILIQVLTSKFVMNLYDNR